MIFAGCKEKQVLSRPAGAGGLASFCGICRGGRTFPAREKYQKLAQACSARCAGTSSLRPPQAAPRGSGPLENPRMCHFVLRWSCSPSGLNRTGSCVKVEASIRGRIRQSLPFQTGALPTSAPGDPACITVGSASMSWNRRREEEPTPAVRFRPDRLQDKRKNKFPRS